MPSEKTVKKMDRFIKEQHEKRLQKKQQKEARKKRRKLEDKIGNID